MNIIGIALGYLFDILIGVIVVRSLLTWFPGGYQSQLYDMLSRITDPIEDPIRNITYKYMNGPVDFTPLIAILVLTLLKNVLVPLFF
ncbi:YggT family protein [Clostridium sp. CCUG 7971]|uniref:YggT family protein n=1 Tax=Clostridium sp. CCUG 7971 TaxID=2811414 RepID=UPI001ABB9235|nr:YggT family protein [Clostridium sp. CCUG 7971]MBO3446111.1 YggT family protein [Clostridium sp. CCUG 7971]